MVSKPKILFLDIETAPNTVYSWGLFKQNIAINQIVEPGYTLSWAALWLGKRNKVEFMSVYHDGREAMLKRVHELLDKADIVVHYNGTRFDIPVLNKEFLKERMAPPATFQQVDLLSVVRSRFRLTSNKLDYVAQFLGFEGKVQHKGMDLWRECMAGVASSWRTMKSYNVQDVVLLKKVYNYLLPWISNHPNVNLFNDAAAPHSCPNCGSSDNQKRGKHVTRTLIYQRFQCNACGTWSRKRVNDLPLEKRRGLLVGTM